MTSTLNTRVGPVTANLAGLLTVFVLVALPDVVALGQETDHLQCYRIRDTHSYSGLLNLDSPQFGMTAGCRVRIRGAKFCVPARKEVVELDPGTPIAEFESEPLVFDRICYKVSCPKPVLPPQEVTDQFGTRIISFRSVSEVCTPAVKGPVPNPVCGDAVLDLTEACETAADCTGGAICNSSCECVCGFGQPQCPVLMEATSLAGFGSQITVSEADEGWSGIGHDTDVLDESSLHLDIACSGSPPASCGDCSVLGVNTGPGSCRCANDNRTVCDQPLANDGDDCGGARCECYLAPPTPRSEGSTPRCVVNRLSQSPSGTWNVDTGAGALDLPQRRRVYLGETIFQPCPTCVGDLVAGDGSRDGTCDLGENAGQNCDAQATDATFPAPGGGAYSLDCFPSAGKNVSGTGLAMDLSLTTGSLSLSAGVECGFPPFAPELCPCGVCSGSPSTPCSSNADCAGVGTCGNLSLGKPRANACDNSSCSDVGGGEGECSTGPTTTFCDGITRANGGGLVTCNSNADCTAAVIGVDVGNCTLSKRRECFLDPIVATGTPSTSQPVAVSVSCMSPTASSAINDVLGLPAPARLRLEARTDFPCAGNPTFTYPACP